MKKYKNTLFYIIVTGSFLLLMYWMIHLGKSLETATTTTAIKSTQSLTHNLTTLLSILLLQIVTIIIAARTFGFLFNKTGKRSVIGEVVAGIFLGPSVLGFLFPAYTNFLFPKTSLPVLQIFSQMVLMALVTTFMTGSTLDLINHLFKYSITAKRSFLIK